MPKQDTEYDLPKPFTLYELYRKSGHLNKEKLKCIMSYFTRAHSLQSSNIVYLRKVQRNPINWIASQLPLLAVDVDYSEIGIEEIKDHLKADFANSYVGGGVLSHGCV
jgi:poly(ADP-ribose) glycohydrolase